MAREARHYQYPKLCSKSPERGSAAAGQGSDRPGHHSVTKRQIIMTLRDRRAQRLVSGFVRLGAVRTARGRSLAGIRPARPREPPPRPREPSARAAGTIGQTCTTANGSLADTLDIPTAPHDGRSKDTAGVHAPGSGSAVSEALTLEPEKHRFVTFIRFLEGPRGSLAKDTI